MSEIRRAWRIAESSVRNQFDHLQALDRERAEEELNDPIPRTTAQQSSEPKIVFDSSLARKYLGVGENAKYDEVKRRYDEIVAQCTTAMNSTDSEAKRMAEEITRKAHRAYTMLTQEMTVTEKRFKSLEIY